MDKINSNMYKFLGGFIIFLYSLVILLGTINLDFITILAESINGYIFLSIFVYLLVICLSLLLYRLIIKTEKRYFTVIAIFAFSLIIRVGISLVIRYLPTNDFSSYYNFGVYMVNKDYKSILEIVSDYDLPSFAGMAFLNGLIAQVFGTTVLGLQIANGVMTSLIAVMIYVLGKSVKENYGIIAALVFSIYPSNIIMTQVTTNQHGATLMYFVSFYMILKTIDSVKLKKIFYSLGSGVALVAGNFFHPSVIVSILAICFFSVGVIISSRKDRKKVVGMFAVLLICLLSYKFINIFSDDFFIRMGINEKAEHRGRLSKVVVGLNYKTNGGYSREDYSLIGNAPLEEKDKLCINIIKERLRNPVKLTKLLLTKPRYIWGVSDSTFNWYFDGINKYNSENVAAITEWQKSSGIKFIEGWRIIDFYFVDMLYISTIIGVVLYIKTKGNETINLLMWVLAGWIGVHFFIEIQARYRYFAMPIICIFSSIGIVYLKDIIKNRIQMKSTIKKQVSLDVNNLREMD